MDAHIPNVVYESGEVVVELRPDGRRKSRHMARRRETSLKEARLPRGGHLEAGIANRILSA